MSVLRKHTIVTITPTALTCQTVTCVRARSKRDTLVVAATVPDQLMSVLMVVTYVTLNGVSVLTLTLDTPVSVKKDTMATVNNAIHHLLAHGPPHTAAIMLVLPVTVLT